METVTIVRKESDDSGTFGLLFTPNFTCWTIELPWRDNKPLVSCIPEGKYRCNWALSPKHGPVYHVTGVKGRSEVQIHSGNWAGDTSKGLRSSVQGCICLGRAVGEIAGQKAILSSRDALAAFEDAMDREPFDLVITRQ